MYSHDELMEAFGRIAPVLTTATPGMVLNQYGIDPQAVTTMGNTLIHMLRALAVKPEDAVQTSLAIGIILGLALADENGA